MEDRPQFSCDQSAADEEVSPPRLSPSTATGQHGNDRDGRPRRSQQRPPLDTTRESWKLRKEDIAFAIHYSGNTMPGPDQIPYAAWRHSGDLALQILWEVAEVLQDDRAAS